MRHGAALLIAITLGVAPAQRLAHAPQSTDERIAAIERRVKQSPRDAELLDELAGAYLQKMRETADGSYLERAARLVNDSLAVNPSRYETRRRQIEVEMQRHHFRRAVDLAGALAKKRPDDPALLGLLGDAFMELGEYDRAADTYQKMADLRPDLASYNRVAFYRFVTGDPEGAIDIMQRAIRMGSAEPENLAWCLSDLGGMLFKTGAIDQAGQAYRQALSLFPGYYHALAGMGRVLAAQNRFDDAIQFLVRAQARTPFPEYAGLLAKLYRKTGREELAARQIALLDVTDRLGRAAGEAANRNLALALADLGHNTSRALELARAELDVRRDVYTYDTLAWALFRNGQLAQAGEAIEKALSQNTPEPSFYEHAARIFDALGRADLARRHRERSATLNARFDVT